MSDRDQEEVYTLLRECFGKPLDGTQRAKLGAASLLLAAEMDKVRAHTLAWCFEYFAGDAPPSQLEAFTLAVHTKMGTLKTEVGSAREVLAECVKLEVDRVYREELKKVLDDKDRHALVSVFKPET